MQWKWFLKSLQKYLGSPCMSVCAKSLQSCPTFWDPMDRSLQACLSLRFFRQEYWNRLPFPSPGDLPNPGIKPASMAQPNWHINEPSQSLPGPLPSPLGWDLPEPCGAITLSLSIRAGPAVGVQWGELRRPALKSHILKQMLVQKCPQQQNSPMQSTPRETLGWKKNKLESRLPEEISITSDMQMTPPFGRKWRGTKKPLDESERGEWKSCLKAQHSEN